MTANNKNICNQLDIDIVSTLSKPIREDYIHGKDMKISYKDKKIMKSYISKEIKKFPELPNDLLDLFS